MEFTASSSGALPAIWRDHDTSRCGPSLFAPVRQAVATVTDLTTKASGQVDLCEAQQVTVSGGGAKLELLTPVGIGAGSRRNYHYRLHNPMARPGGTVPGHLL